MRGRHLVESLIYGNLAAIVLGQLNGRIPLPALLSLPTTPGGSTGLIEDGIASVVSPIVFALLVLALTRVLVDSGVMGRVLQVAERHMAGSVRQAEGTISVVTALVSIPIAANFGEAIILTGDDVALDESAQSINIKLVWQARQPMNVSYTSFVHALDPAGQVQGQVDRIPGDGRWPTDDWEAGEWITDSFSVALNPERPSTELAVVVGLYDFQTLERLPIIGGDEGQTVVYLTTVFSKQ